MERNFEKLPTIYREIGSAVIISSDGLVLMGRKDPTAGGVYPAAWHIPGGGTDPGEALEDCMRREVTEEVPGIDLNGAIVTPYDNVGHGETVKTIDGQRHWCKMKFNRFKVQLPKTAAELSATMQPGDDLVELKWFNREELETAEQIPGGREFFEEAGLI